MFQGEMRLIITKLSQLPLLIWTTGLSTKVVCFKNSSHSPQFEHSIPCSLVYMGSHYANHWTWKIPQSCGLARFCASFIFLLHFTEL